MTKNLTAVIGRAINYDFCPSFNRYVYWLKHPVGWIICGISFSALVGILIGPQGFVLMWALIAFLIVGAIWPWLGMKGINCRLEFDSAHSQEQQPTVARLIVTNGWPIPVFGLTVEGQFLQDILEDNDQVAVGLHRIPAWSESEFTWEFKPERRGVLPQNAPVIATGFPFGLYQSEKSINVDRRVIVWPKCEPLSSVREIDGVNFNIEGGFCDRPGHDGDVIGTRPYRRGDSTKHINWSKTASSGKLVVLERQTAAQKAIRIVVDLAPRYHRGLGSRSSYEWAIRVAATVVKHMHLHHSRICLTCEGLPENVANESNNARGLKPVLDYLATLPTLEQSQESSSNLNASGSKNGNDSTIVRANEEVYWIGSEDAHQSRVLQGLASHTHDIVLGNGTGQTKRHPGDSAGNDVGQLVVINGWSDTQEQIRLGWERLCCDA